MPDRSAVLFCVSKYDTDNGMPSQTSWYNANKHTKTPTPFEDVGVICLILFFRLEQILYNYLTVTNTAFLIAFAVSHVPFTLAAIATL